jgi:Flp pilus assembly pilin Flp
MREVLEQLLQREDGQDLVEYALLVAFVGVAALAAWLAIENALASGYTGWDATDQNLGAVTPDPQ